MSRYKLYNSAGYNKSMLYDTKHDVIAGFEEAKTADDIERLKQYSAEYWYSRARYYKEEMKDAVLVAEWD